MLLELIAESHKILPYLCARSVSSHVQFERHAGGWCSWEEKLLLMYMGGSQKMLLPWALETFLTDSVASLG